MAVHQSGLGKGLGALFRETENTRSENSVHMLAISHIEPNARQPRRDFDEAALAELADSIRSQGILQPLLVRPLGPGKPGKYEIVAGERRWRAAKLVGLSEVPVHVRTFSEQETLIAALVENLQREDLNPIEEAFGLQVLKDDFAYSQDEISKKIGKSRSAIANALRLLSLPDAIRADIAEGRLTSGHGRALLSVTDDAARDILRAAIINRQLSVREAEGQASVWKETGAFDLGEAGGDLEGMAADVQAAQERAAEQINALGKGSGKSRPQSARLLEIQNRISDLFRIPVKVTGKDEKGKISFSYNSREELEALLERLAFPALEGATHQALEGQSHISLQGTQHDALSGSDNSMLTPGEHRDALDSHGREALAGADHAVLEGSDNTALDGRKQEALGASPYFELSARELSAEEEEQAAADAEQAAADAEHGSEAEETAQHD